MDIHESSEETPELAPMQRYPPVAGGFYPLCITLWIFPECSPKLRPRRLARPKRYPFMPLKG